MRHPADFIRDLFSTAFNQANRPLRLRFAGARGKVFEGVLVPQRADVTEALCDGNTAHLTCLTTRSDLPLEELIGLPIELQLATDAGSLRRICVVVTQARRGQSDGSLTTIQLTGRDIFGVMEGRRSNRVFLNKSVLDIARIVLNGWRQRFPAVGHAFEYLLLGLAESVYPARAFTFQAHQSDADFLRSLLRRNGISWFFRAFEGHGGGRSVGGSEANTAVQQLVLFDDGYRLPENSAGPIRYHRRSGTETRDTISLLAPVHTLVGGSVARTSYDHEAARADLAQESNVLHQGSSADEFAAALVDARIELPHAGDSWADHARLTRLDMQREEFRAKCLHGVGGVRDMAPGSYHRIDDHPMLGAFSPADREYITIRNQLWAENSLPKVLNESVQALLGASAAGIEGWVASGLDGSDEIPQDERNREHRFTNRFIAVRRDVPIVPAWNPETDLPRMPPMTAVVVGPEGEPVWCDELGRVKVRILGLDPADHAHAGGAGTNGDDGDSAWVRVNSLWAGNGFGVIYPLRAGMEVSLAFEGSEASRPIITGSRHNAANSPPRFDHLGDLPANRALSGVVTKEILGARQQQLRFNDTPGNISVQLGSDHAASQLNLGALATPMNQGQTKPRGEGFELRSDESGAIRTAKSLLISAWKRLQASGTQLSAEEHVALMQDCLDLFKSLGDYAAQHHGLATDDKAQADLNSEVKAAATGSNVEPAGEGGKPTLSLTAPNGVATTTPKTIVSYAGVNIDAVAQQHMQYAAGQRYNVNAGQGIGFFAHQGGINAIAHHGTLTMQSQHDDTLVDSAKNIQLRAVENVLLIGKTLSFIAEDGSFIKIGDGGITLGSNGAITHKGASFSHSGPAMMSSEPPTFSEGSPDQKFALLYGGKDSMPAASRRHEITMSDGSVVTGTSDAAGMTQLLQRDAMHIADIQILSDD